MFRAQGAQDCNRDKGGGVVSLLLATWEVGSSGFTAPERRHRYKFAICDDGHK